MTSLQNLHDPIEIMFLLRSYKCTSRVRFQNDSWSDIQRAKTVHGNESEVV